MGEQRVSLFVVFFFLCRLFLYFRRNGCATSEDLFWKLDALQSFIRDLHWPDAEFRQHLEQRLKLMACEMIESCIQRTEASYQSWLKKSVTFISTDYIIPSEMCAMVNVILDAKNQSFKLCAVDGIDVVSSGFFLLFFFSCANTYMFYLTTHSTNTIRKLTIRSIKRLPSWIKALSANWRPFLKLPYRSCPVTMRAVSLVRFSALR